MSITLDTPLKFLAPGGAAVHGQGKWNLPVGDQPGAWMRDLERIALCQSGYHWCHAKHAVHWLNAECYLIETRGETIHGDNKSVSQGARLLRRVETWNERTARLFAADCAEAVLHLCGDDPRPAEAVAVARRYARGTASDAELAAASAAAWDAAWAARAAASDAAWAARAAASDAAWAARVAAGDAAGAARNAAWDAARAARNAAWDAAGAARNAAWDAARNAAWDAAWDAAGAARNAAWDAAGAARNAAWDAARAAQTNRLLQYLNGEVS